MFSLFDRSGDLSNHFGIISSAVMPCASRPSVARIDARTNACGASVTVAAPKRNGSRNVTGRSNNSIAVTVNRGARDDRLVIGVYASSVPCEKKCLRIRCVSATNVGSPITASERGRGSGTS